MRGQEPRISAGWVPLVAVAGGVLVIDQLTKFVVRHTLDVSESVPVIASVLHITHVRNPGAAFGLLPNQQLLFFAVSGAAISFVITYWLRARPSEWPLVVALGLLLGGASGNLIDRITLGTVTDFLDLRFWPVFNVADSSIVIGLALIVLTMLLGGRDERRPERKEAV